MKKVKQRGTNEKVVTVCTYLNKSIQITEHAFRQMLKNLATSGPEESQILKNAIFLWLYILYILNRKLLQVQYFKERKTIN